MKTWNRLCWGVVFSSPQGRRLLGSLWRQEKCIPYPDEPTRAMLFVSRAAARRWCQAEHAKYVAYPNGGVYRRWRFCPVRVRETVKVVRG